MRPWTFADLMQPVRRPGPAMVGMSARLYRPGGSRTMYRMIEDHHDAQDRNHFDGTPLTRRCDRHDNRRT